MQHCNRLDATSSPHPRAGLQRENVGCCGNASTDASSQCKSYFNRKIVNEKTLQLVPTPGDGSSESCMAIGHGWTSSLELSTWCGFVVLSGDALVVKPQCGSLQRFEPNKFFEEKLNL